MAIEYTWEVTGIKVTSVANTDNVVVQTYWKKTGTDGNHTGSFSGATPFSADTIPAGTTFIPFDQLTEADVLTWIKGVVVGQYEQHVNDAIQREIDKSKNPVVDATLPWAPAANVTPTLSP